MNSLKVLCLESIFDKDATQARPLPDNLMQELYDLVLSRRASLPQYCSLLLHSYYSAHIHLKIPKFLDTPELYDHLLHSPCLLLYKSLILDLDDCSGLRDDTLLALLRRLGERVAGLSLANCFITNDPLLEGLPHCPNLRSLNVRNCWIDSKVIRKLGLACPALEELDVTNCELLEPASLLQALAQLKALKILRQSEITEPIPFLRLANFDLKLPLCGPLPVWVSLLKLCPLSANIPMNLQHVNWGSVTRLALDENSFSPFLAFANQLQNLRELDLQGMDVSDEFEKLHSVDGIRKLRLRYVSIHNTEALYKFISHNVHLEKLLFSRTLITEDLIEILNHSNTNLRVLELHTKKKIKNSQKLVLPLLRKLSLPSAHFVIHLDCPALEQIDNFKSYLLEQGGRPFPRLHSVSLTDIGDLQELLESPKHLFPSLRTVLIGIACHPIKHAVTTEDIEGWSKLLEARPEIQIQTEIFPKNFKYTPGCKAYVDRATELFVEGSEYSQDLRKNVPLDVSFLFSTKFRSVVELGLWNIELEDGTLFNHLQTSFPSLKVLNLTNNHTIKELHITSSTLSDICFIHWHALRKTNFSCPNLQKVVFDSCSFYADSCNTDFLHLPNLKSLVCQNSSSCETYGAERTERYDWDEEAKSLPDVHVSAIAPGLRSLGMVTCCFVRTFKLCNHDHLVLLSLSSLVVMEELLIQNCENLKLVYIHDALHLENLCIFQVPLIEHVKLCSLKVGMKKCEIGREVAELPPNHYEISWTGEVSGEQTLKCGNLLESLPPTKIHHFKIL
eukprot:TRINITY_DN17094_c0_g1_i1.p1 TRINITY_DN17094_c0_g1~~TRINITY_DN17094_c0_g1_i1.p1  ORF type:complete len:788 (-),score=131.89 TRINITY_DN17094_c0_g1_i1:34-2397(-)